MEEDKKRKLLIALVIVLFVLLLALVAFFVYKLKTEKTTTPQSTNTASDQSTEKTRALSNAFLYPGATIAEPYYNANAGQKLTLQMTTIEPVDKVSDYYKSLSELNSWSLGSNGVSADGSGGWLNIEQPDFTGNVNITRAGNTTSIEIAFYYENETLTSSMERLPEY